MRSASLLCSGARWRALIQAALVVGAVHAQRGSAINTSTNSGVNVGWHWFPCVLCSEFSGAVYPAYLYQGWTYSFGLRYSGVKTVSYRRSCSSSDGVYREYSYPSFDCSGTPTVAEVTVGSCVNNVVLEGCIDGYSNPTSAGKNLPPSIVSPRVNFTLGCSRASNGRIELILWNSGSLPTSATGHPQVKGGLTVSYQFTPESWDSAGRGVCVQPDGYLTDLPVVLPESDYYNPILVPAAFAGLGTLYIVAVVIFEARFGEGLSNVRDIIDWHEQVYTAENAKDGSYGGCAMKALLALWPLTALVTILPLITVPLTVSNYFVCDDEYGGVRVNTMVNVGASGSGDYCIEHHYLPFILMGLFTLGWAIIMTHCFARSPLKVLMPIWKFPVEVSRERKSTASG